MLQEGAVCLQGATRRPVRAALSSVVHIMLRHLLKQAFPQGGPQKLFR